MNKHLRTIGWLLIHAALTFWISWFLMPDPGTTDTRHILEIVNQSRTAVLLSVITQIISSVLYLITLFLLVKRRFSNKAILTGAILFGIGAMGLCADAFFHLLAYFMTDKSVTIQQDVIQVMDFMQTAGVVFLLPLLLSLFIGGLVLIIGLHKQRIISGISQWIIIGGFGIGIISAVSVKMNFLKEAIPVIAILGLFAAGQVLAGFQLIRIPRRTT